MFDEDSIPEEDVIDAAFLDMIHEAFGEDIEEEDLDGATDVLLQIVGEFVDAGDMQEIPENEAPEEEKSKWLSDNLDKIKKEFNDSVFLEEPDGNQNNSP